ncbi:MAG: TRAP transporter large permease [Polyangiaceae bacterium]|nr:TRAP transporter large permease [Polyangiaceae bacterium]MCW5792549.1 TRAP transporter large permease [Polyangiaceae bacterium]
MPILLFVLVFALLGAPVFAVMAGTTELAWLLHGNENQRFVRFLAPDVLDNRFAGSPILVTVPLFTLVGYLMAESKTPQRLVRASTAFFGWLPGGLAIVCIFASAFFTTLTGGSAVTIVAIGALLYPALKASGYPEKYSLGLIMTGGSLGLLLPPSLPILVYSLVAGIDFTKAFKATLIPGGLIMLLLSLHAIYVAKKHNIPRTKPNLAEMGSSLWAVKWELLIPVIILGGLFTGVTSIDEIAAMAALYVFVIEVWVYKDLKLKDIPRIVKSAIALAGALILIMAMAVALTNYVVNEQIPRKLFDWVTGMGVTETWHFLITLNVFLYVQGMFMDGFSSILVAVPLLIPFAAKFGISPFHLAMMFLLNLEIAYLSPPLGQNLFVASFRFNRPMAQLYRVAVPFIGVLIIGLVILMTVPKLSTVAIEPDIAKAKAEAAKYEEPPREAWLMECVQEDRNNPLPCSDEDKQKWAHLYGKADAGAETDADDWGDEDDWDDEDEDEDSDAQEADAGADQGADDAGSADGDDASDEDDDFDDDLDDEDE